MKYKGIEFETEEQLALFIEKEVQEATKLERENAEKLAKEKAEKEAQEKIDAMRKSFKDKAKDEAKTEAEKEMQETIDAMQNEIKTQKEENIKQAFINRMTSFNLNKDMQDQLLGSVAIDKMNDLNLEPFKVSSTGHNPQENKLTQSREDRQAQLRKAMRK